MRYESSLIKMAAALGFDKMERKPLPLLQTRSDGNWNSRFDDAYRRKRRIRNRIARESRRRNR